MITIIGGGISGITTGLILQLLGRGTEIYAEYLVSDVPSADPRFASNYPAASIIPHSVHSNHLTDLFADSMKVFEALYNNDFPAMEQHRHYEVYEFPVDEPKYTNYLQNFNPIQDENDNLVPRRHGIDEVYGWAFDCYVAEWPAYIMTLYSLYEENGGVINHKKIERDDIKKLSFDIIINCAGVWSKQLFDDDQEPQIIRGHLIHSLDSPKVRDSIGRICSYNYNPHTSVYATPAGEPCDVYFYPIGNKWVVGGSRQPGRLNDDGKWTGNEENDTVLIDGIETPEQIITLNTEILENTYQVSLPSKEQLKTFIGYRFSRGTGENSLRLERTEEMGKTIIHNYGHGGAGVTLSWGCALQVARLMNLDASAVQIVKKLL